MYAKLTVRRLYGVTTLQSFIYFQKYPNDAMSLKLLVRLPTSSSSPSPFTYPTRAGRCRLVRVQVSNTTSPLSSPLFHAGHSKRCTPASACCSSTSTSSRASATLPTSSTSTGASPAPRALRLRSAMTTNLMCSWRCRGIGVSLCRCAKRNELGTDADHDGSRAGGRLRSLLV